MRTAKSIYGSREHSCLLFYMNWGAGRNTDPNATYNGWFASNDVEYEEGNPQYLRTTIYVSVP